MVWDQKLKSLFSFVSCSHAINHSQSSADSKLPHGWIKCVIAPGSQSQSFKILFTNNSSCRRLLIRVLILLYCTWQVILTMQVCRKYFILLPDWRYCPILRPIVQILFAGMRKADSAVTVCRHAKILTDLHDQIEYMLPLHDQLEYIYTLLLFFILSVALRTSYTG